MEREKTLKPLLLHYFITNRCNAACAFCSIWKDKPKVDAVRGDVAANLAAARQAGCSFVDFTGGEPLLHSDLPVFLREAKRIGFITSVTTNCICFPERASELNGLVDLLHFSLDADNEALHDKLRGSESYNKVLESIPLALSNNLAPDILFTYTNENINSFSGVYALARKNKLMVILDPVFSIDGKDMASRATHGAALAWAGKPGVYLNRAHLKLRFMGGNKPGRNYCRAASAAIVITPENRLALPCYHHATEFVPVQDSLDKVLNSPQRLEAIKFQGRYLFCEGCHINCYFDPSYCYTVSSLCLSSLLAKASYAFRKYALYQRKIPLRFF
ncbi:MAG TPA: radical SAM protein [Chitinivibrionales bacterium]|nr:radical SAM protein [Chitinivibrionales bacterium]